MIGKVVAHACFVRHGRVKPQGKLALLNKVGEMPMGIEAEKEMSGAAQHKLFFGPEKGQPEVFAVGEQILIGH